MKWVSVKDRLPEKNGKYTVKTVEGSISPHEHERVLLGRLYPTGFRFLVGDWQYVTHWMEGDEMNTSTDCTPPIGKSTIDLNGKHSGLEKIKPIAHELTRMSFTTADMNIALKLNEVIENQNKIIDYLNEMVRK